MDTRIEQSQFDLVAFFDRFAALGRAMQRETQAATVSEFSKLDIRTAASNESSEPGQ